MKPARNSGPERARVCDAQDRHVAENTFVNWRECRSAESGSSTDRRDFYLGDVRLVAIQVGVAGIARFDGSNFALAEQPEKIPQPPAGEGHVMGEEKQLEAIRGPVHVWGFGFVLWNLFQRVVHQLGPGEAMHAVVSGDELDKGCTVAFLDAVAFIVAAVLAVAGQLIVSGVPATS